VSDQPCVEIGPIEPSPYFRQDEFGSYLYDKDTNEVILIIHKKFRGNHKMNSEKARREFSIMIDRCGCSRAGIYITEEEIKESGLPMEVQAPRCTPHLCFPELMNLLYPNGGFNKKSNMFHQTMHKFTLVTKPQREKDE